MKKLIELSKANHTRMNKILCEEYNCNPKKAYKFGLIHESDNDGLSYRFYLAYRLEKGKMDNDFYGELMYKLGLEASKG